MNTLHPPPLPSTELLTICQNATKGMAWAVAQDEDGTWFVYCSSKKQINRIPSTYRGQKVEMIHCSKPRITD